MINKKEVLDKIEKEIRMLERLRKAGYGKEIDEAYSLLKSEKITEDQYWAYIKRISTPAEAE
jgi:hypothetical protein